MSKTFTSSRKRPVTQNLLKTLFWDQGIVTLVISLCFVLVGFFWFNLGRAQLAPESPTATVIENQKSGKVIVPRNSNSQNFAEQDKIIYPILASLGTILPSFIVAIYVQGQIEHKKQDLEKRFEDELEMKLQDTTFVERLKILTHDEVYAEEEHQYLSHLVYALQQKYPKLSLEDINLSNVPPSVATYLTSSGQPIQELLKDSEADLSRQLAWAALINPVNQRILIDTSLKAAIDAIEGMTIEKFRIRSKEDEGLNKFPIDLYAYLRGWLVCSLAFKRYMNIDIVKQNFPYRSSYIKAIRLLEERSFNANSSLSKTLFDKFSDSENHKSIEGARNCIRTHLRYLTSQLSSR